MLRLISSAKMLFKNYQQVYDQVEQHNLDEDQRHIHDDLGEGVC